MRRACPADVVQREKDVLAEKFKAQGKPANVIEKIVEFGPQDLLQGSLPARSALHPRRQEERGQARRKPKARSARRSRSPALCASRSARASRSRKAISPRKSRPLPDKADGDDAVARGGGQDGQSREEPFRLPPRHRQSFRRSARRSRRLRHPSADHRPHRQGSGRRAQARRHAWRGGGRRQYSSRRAESRQGPVASDRGRDGHAGDGDERAGARSGDRAVWRRGAHHVGARHAAGLRGLRAAARAAPPRRKPRRGVRRRHRKSVLHHRHDGRAARRRNGLRRGAQGDRRRRRLQRRPEEGPAKPSATRR